MRVLLMPRLLLKYDGDLDEKCCRLQPGPPCGRPEKWAARHVRHRFAAAMETLRTLPMGRLRPADMHNSWPGYALDWNTFMGRMSADIPSMAVEGKLDQEFVAAY